MPFHFNRLAITMKMLIDILVSLRKVYAWHVNIEVQLVQYTQIYVYTAVMCAQFLMNKLYECGV